MPAYVNNDNDIVVTGLSRESDGTWINDAVLAATLYDLTGAAIGGATSVPYVAGSNGNYRGTIPAGSPALSANSRYECRIVASNYGFSYSVWFLARTRT